MANSLTLKKEHLCFGGKVAYYSHQSQTCQCEMNLAIYLPPQTQYQKVPILYYLSGLTCTEDNFTIKAGAQRWAAEYGLMLVIPDTSPRNTNIPGEDEEWFLGSGAGFYVDATVAPWQNHYQMYSYVVGELPSLIAANFPIKPEKQGIFGHSMGGHGALICALKNPGMYKSVSAFAPITAPMSASLGAQAFSHYLGTDRDQWKAYDASELVKETQLDTLILIDQGKADSFFLDNELRPDIFAQACGEVGQALELRYQEGYDHSYFFVSSFIADHLRHHAEILNG